MKNKLSIISPLIIVVLSLLLNSCEEFKPPFPDFYASEYASTNKEITVAFTDYSTENPQEWFWVFEGGTPSVSYKRDPIVTYDSPGTYNVTLSVRNENGTKEVTKYDYISIGDFYNPTWTDIYITHNSENKIVPIDDYILLANIGGPVIDYYAETSGLTNVGEQIGLLIFWEESLNLDESLYWDFVVDDYFVFIDVQNYGPDDFYPLYVNWNDPEYEIVDYITIENDGLWKSTGYYDAWDFMEIRAFFKTDPDTWVS